MHIPNQRPPVGINGSFSRTVSSSLSKGIVPSQRPIPSSIKIALKELGKAKIDFDGNFLCATAIYGALDNYANCLGRPGNTERGCALDAARLIAGPICDTYCSTLCG
jgi:hypothetical protein